MAGNSSHYGDSNDHQRSGGTSSSYSRKNSGKKSNSDKPKQPQRGLGVAQLEKIRMHGELSSGGGGDTRCHFPPPPPPPPPLPLQNPYIPNLLQEDIMRIQTAYSSSSSSYSYSAQSSSPIYGFHGNPTMMGMSDIERANFANSQLNPNRWSHDNAFFDTQVLQPSMTRQLFDGQDSIKRKDESESSGGNEEVDLELRLSFKSP